MKFSSTYINPKKFSSVNLQIGYEELIYNAFSDLVFTLNPVFYIKDLTNIVGGYLFDESGNNKQIAVSTTTFTNDTITMPANDADIINAVTLAGFYNFFYTDNAHPNSVKVCEIRSDYSNFLFMDYKCTQIALFAYAITGTDIIWIDKYIRRTTTNPNRYTANLNKNVNYFNSTGSAIIDPSGVTGRYFTLGGITTITNNAFAWSITKKTLISSIASSINVQGLINIVPGKFCGKYTLGFWIDKSTLVEYFFLYGWLLHKTWDWTGLTHTATNLDIAIDAIQGNWHHFTIKSINVQTSSTNRLISDSDIPLYHFGSVGVALDIAFTDFVLINDYIPFNIANDYGNVLTSDFENKKICIIGDSISLWIWGNLIGTFLDCSNVVIAGKAGSKMGGTGPGNALWTPENRAIISATNADIFIIYIGTNEDLSQNLGDINGIDLTKSFDSYNYFINYLKTNNPSSIILLITLNKNYGGYVGHDPAVTRNYFNSDYVLTYNNGVKALAAKYGIKYCDLELQRPYNFDTGKFFLADGVHWGYTMDAFVANLISQFIKDNY